MNFPILGYTLSNTSLPVHEKVEKRSQRKKRERQENYERGKRRDREKEKKHEREKKRDGEVLKGRGE